MKDNQASMCSRIANTLNWNVVGQNISRLENPPSEFEKAATTHQSSSQDHNASLIEA